MVASVVPSPKPPFDRDRANAVGNYLQLARVGTAAIDALQGAGVEVVVLKGAALVGWVWRPEERSMTDIDLLVPAASRKRCYMALEHAGFTQWLNHERPWTTEVFHQRVFMRDGLCVDLHTEFDDPWRWRVDYPWVFERAQPTTLLGAATKRLSVEDCILQLAIHASKDQFVSGRSLEDVVRVAQRCNVDWRGVTARARAWGCTAVLWIALRGARVRGLEIPDQVLDGLRPRGLRRRYLEALVAEDGRFRYPHWNRRRQLALRSVLPDSTLRNGLDLACLLGRPWVDLAVLGWRGARRRKR